MSFRYDVFLSHNQVDAAWTQALARRLRRCLVQGQRVTVFHADSAVPPGSSVPRAIVRALASSRHLACVLTPEWVGSEWCRLEEEIAVYRDPVALRRVLIPLLLRDCDAPPELTRLRWIDFRSPERFNTALSELLAVIRQTAVLDQEERLRTAQRETVLNTPVLPWTPRGSPSFDFLWPDMLVDSLVRPHKHPHSPLRFKAWRGDGLKEHRRSERAGAHQLPGGRS